MLGVVLRSADAAQESAAAWNADDDAHEDKSEIDEQLNCVRRINQSINSLRAHCNAVELLHILASLTHDAGLHARPLQCARCSNLHNRSPGPARGHACPCSHQRHAPHPTACSVRTIVLVDQNCHIDDVRRRTVYPYADC